MRRRRRRVNFDTGATGELDCRRRLGATPSPPQRRRGALEPPTCAAAAPRRSNRAGFDAYRVGADCLLPLWGDHYHPIYDEWRYWSNVVAVRRGDALADACARMGVDGLDDVSLEEALGGVG